MTLTADQGAVSLTTSLPAPDLYVESSAMFDAYFTSRGRRRRALDPVPADLIVAEAIEQVMRVSGDEDLLLDLLSATPGTTAAASAAGRVMSSRPVHLSLTAGCPVLAFATGTSLDVGWRRWCNVAPESLFSELLVYRSLTTGDLTFPDADYLDTYEELEALRSTIGAL